MPGWFDLYDWPIGIGAKDDPDGTTRAVNLVEAHVRSLKEQKGIERDRIFLAGFSQGGAIAMLAAYHGNSGGRFAGCASLSGWLTGARDLTISKESKEKTPLFWGHGEYDDKVLFEQQKYGVQKLKEEGVKDIVAKKYPVGHQGHPEEIQSFAEFLNKVLFAEDECEN